MISVLVMSILIFLESFDNANFFHEMHKGQAVACLFDIFH